MLFRSDRKSTRLNSSHTIISYAVFCLKKKNRKQRARAAAPGRRHKLLREHRHREPARFPRPTHRTSMRWKREFTPSCLFFFNDTATTEIYTLSLHDALPI